MKKKSKIIIAGVGGIIMAAVVVFITLFVASGSDGRKYEKHMELAQQYLDELQYEQAIAEYELAIAIDPKNEEAYQALAELYVKTGDYASAVTVLNRGIEQAGTEELEEILAEVQESWEEQRLQTAAQAQAAGQKQVEIVPREQENATESEQRETIQEFEQQENPQESAEESGSWEETIPEEDGSYRIKKYDADGNCVKETQYDGDGNCKKETEYYEDRERFICNEYDGQGNLIRETQKDYGYIECSEFDTSGLLLKKTWSEKDYVVEEYEYDENRTLIKIISYWYWWDETDETDEFPVQIEVLPFRIEEYDANWNLLKSTDYDAEGKVLAYEIYEYDAAGNLIKSTRYDASGEVINETTNDDQ